jgi:DNA-binding MarR family transcriptional regulator
MAVRTSTGEPSPRSKGSEAVMSKGLAAGHTLHCLARELSAVLDRGFAPFGLTAQQAALLVRSAGRPTPKEVAPLLGTDTAGMTRLLDRLEAKGLVRRVPNPDDRRSVVIEPTAKGRGLTPHLPAVFGRVNAQMLTGFTEDEIDQFTATLGRMSANLAALDPTGDSPSTPRVRSTGTSQT